VNNPLDGKENDKHALDFALHFPLGGLLPFSQGHNCKSSYCHRTLDKKATSLEAI
jgi:hypothetical protein